jgi:tetratricopeptide (TPR) repeat protein
MLKKLRLDLFLIGLLLCFFLNSNSLLAWSPTAVPTLSTSLLLNHQANQATTNGAYKRANSIRGTVPHLFHLASQAYGRGQLSEAIRYAEDVISTLRGSSEPSSQLNLARALTLQAQAYNALGQFDVAIPKLPEAIEIAQEFQSLELEIVAQGILGNAYTLSGNYDRAIEVYRISFNLAQTLQQDNLAVTALNNISSTLAKRSRQYKRMAASARAEGNQTEEKRLSQLAQRDLLDAKAFALAGVEEYQAEGIIALQAFVNLLDLLIRA